MESLFDFRNFKASESLYVYANTMLAQLAELVPADSTVLATLAKDLGNYICRIEIFSQSGKFAANAQNEDPINALNEIDTKVKEIISKWHITRSVDSDLDLLLSRDHNVPDLLDAQKSGA